MSTPSASPPPLDPHPQLRPQTRPPRRCRRAAGGQYLVEVFAPNPTDARDIAASGQVVPVS
ncbi:MAG: hypothetical protein ACR2HD_04685 [Solirubrobacteraceae bacterium]